MAVVGREHSWSVGSVMSRRLPSSGITAAVVSAFAQAECQRLPGHSPTALADSGAGAAFAKIYSSDHWANGTVAKYPSSGAGSTLRATTTTCDVLQRAVLRVVDEMGEQNKRRGAASHIKPAVRILDTPCGDYTWMPACLWRIAQSTKTPLDYQGVDVVASLIQAHNEKRMGGHLDGQPYFEPLLTILPFRVGDVSDAAQMAHYHNAFDIIVSKHMLIHTPNAFVSRVLANWNASGASMLLTDNWPHRVAKGEVVDENRPNDDISAFGKYREVNLHLAPFSLGAPLCSTVDKAMCDEAPWYKKGSRRAGCRPEIGIYQLPFKPREGMAGSRREADCLVGAENAV